jgi:type VI protein secretion system component VasK
MLLLIVPVVTWSKRGTLITWNDILKAVGIPFLSVAVGVGAIWLLAGQLAQLEPALLRLTAESAILFGTYFVMLMFIFRQWTTYNTLLRDTGLGRRTAPKRESAVNELAALGAQRWLLRSQRRPSHLSNLSRAHQWQQSGNGERRERPAPSAPLAILGHQRSENLSVLATSSRQSQRHTLSPLAYVPALRAGQSHGGHIHRDKLVRTDER